MGEEEIKEYIALNSAKLVPRFIKIFNLMDHRCKKLCMENDSRPFTDYCKRCQEMARKIMEE